MMNKAILPHGGEVLDDFAKTKQTGQFQCKAQGIDIYGNPKQHIWGYFSQNQEDWWNARQMEERRVFYHSCKMNE
jgi:hypothetical protein